MLVRWISARKMIPVIIMVNSNDDALSAIEMKAVDFICKPVTSQIIGHQIDRIINHLKEMKMNTKINIKINDELKNRTRLIRADSQMVSIWEPSFLSVYNSCKMLLFVVKQT